MRRTSLLWGLLVGVGCSQNSPARAPDPAPPSAAASQNADADPALVQLERKKRIVEFARDAKAMVEKVRSTPEAPENLPKLRETGDLCMRLGGELPADLASNEELKSKMRAIWFGLGGLQSFLGRPENRFNVDPAKAQERDKALDLMMGQFTADVEAMEAIIGKAD